METDGGYPAERVNSIFGDSSQERRGTLYETGYVISVCAVLKNRLGFPRITEAEFLLHS